MPTLMITYITGPFSITSIKRIATSLLFSILFLACNKIECSDPPGYGVSLYYRHISCDSLIVNGESHMPWGASLRTIIYIKIDGSELDVDPEIPSRVKNYLENKWSSEIGGSALWYITYCDKVCSSMIITSKSLLFSQPPGEDLSMFFKISYSEEIQFDTEYQVVGHGLIDVPLETVLNNQYLMIPSMYLSPVQDDVQLSEGTSLTITMNFTDGSTLEGNCTIK